MDRVPLNVLIKTGLRLRENKSDIQWLVPFFKRKEPKIYKKTRKLKMKHSSGTQEVEKLVRESM